MPLPAFGGSGLTADGGRVDEMLENGSNPWDGKKLM
jgi:hypothetical protein